VSIFNGAVQQKLDVSVANVSLLPLFQSSGCSTYWSEYLRGLCVRGRPRGTSLS